MKTLLKFISISMLGLSLLSCDKNEPIIDGNSDPVINGGGGVPSEVKESFELSCPLKSEDIQFVYASLESPVNETLRATLHFNGANKSATTTLNPKEFGSGKREARWGVIYDGGKYHSVTCEKSVSVAPTTTPIKNTVFFKDTGSSTIQGSSIKMYCQSLIALPNITKGFMCLDGKGGSGTDITKQYFKDDTAPNHRLEGVKLGQFQDGRHIPIMTEVVDFSLMNKPTATSSVKFSPRGSLIGLNVKNEIDAKLTITAVEVKQAGGLSYSGYFDWSQAGKASFTSEDAPNKDFSFPVYQKGASKVGYTLAKQGTACFYLWGFQNPKKLGEPIKLQFSYKLASGEVGTTRVFTIKAPHSKLVGGTKQFDDGYAYNTTLKIKIEPNEEVLTPLDFVAENVVNKAGTGLVKHNNLPTKLFDWNSMYSADVPDTGVGYYRFPEAQALFSEKAWLKNGGYYLPNVDQWAAISYRSYRPDSGWDPNYAQHLGYLNFENTRPGGYLPINKKMKVLEKAQVGMETTAKEYPAEFLRVKEVDGSVIYAVRFKGSKWVSAWRYSRSKDWKKLIIECVALKNKPSEYLDLDNISNPEFFTNNSATKRIFPTWGIMGTGEQGAIQNKVITGIGVSASLWSSTIYESPNATRPAGRCFIFFVYYDSYHKKTTDGSIHVTANPRDYGFPVRPFRHP